MRGKFKAECNSPITVYFLDYRVQKLNNTDCHINSAEKQWKLGEMSVATIKSLRMADLTSSVNIVYPTKLITDGRILTDMFPHWSLIKQGNCISFNKPMFTNTIIVDRLPSHINRISR